MNDLSNKIINTNSAYIKIGKFNHIENSAGYFCEVLDFLGEIKGPLLTLEDRRYCILSYKEIEAAENNPNITDQEFNKKLVEHIINLALSPNDGAFDLNFKRTDERMMFLKTLMASKK